MPNKNIGRGLLNLTNCLLSLNESKKTFLTFVLRVAIGIVLGPYLSNDIKNVIFGSKLTDHHFTIQNGCGGVALHLTTLETKTLRNVLGKINDRMFTKNNPKRPKTKIGGEEEEQTTNMGIAILTYYFGKRIYQANKLLQIGT